MIKYLFCAMMRNLTLTFAVAVCLLASCTNPFSTRTPEAPSGDTSIDRNLQTDPNQVLTKIQQAFQQKDTQAYQDCFADSTLIGSRFVFTPEQNESYRLNNWEIADERNYFFNLVNAEELQTVDIQYPGSAAIPTPVTSSPDTLEIDFNYLITAEFRTKTEMYQGRSILRILKSPEELWYVYEWLDLRNSTDISDSTWSTLKANYRISG